MLFQAFPNIHCSKIHKVRPRMFLKTFISLKVRHIYEGRWVKKGFNWKNIWMIVVKAAGRTMGESEGVLWVSLGFLGGAVVKKKKEKSICQCRRRWRHGFNPWVRKILWIRNGNPLQCSCLETLMDRGAWWGPWGHRESDLTEQSPAAMWVSLLRK